MQRNCWKGMFFVVLGLLLLVGKGDALPGRALEVSGISLSKRIPKEGDKVLVVATVANGSQANLDKVQVEFFVTNPEGKKAPLGSPQTVAELKAGESKEIQVEWNPAVNGIYSLKAVAKAGNEKAEASLEAPVTARDLYFVWYATVGDCVRHGLRWANVANYAGGPLEMGFTTGNQGAWIGGGQTADQYAEWLATLVADGNPKVFLLDEIAGEVENPDHPGMQGLIKFIKSHPDVPCFLYMAGVPYPAQVKALPKQPNVFPMPEIYVSLYRQELNEWGDGHYEYLENSFSRYRPEGWLPQTIPALCIAQYNHQFDTNPADLEKQIRFCKTRAPECPGVGFFHIGNPVPGIIPVADKLCYKYYIRPVLALYPEDVQVSPSGAGGEVKIEATVRNVGGMDARNVRLRFYAKLAGGPKKAIGKETITVVPAMRKATDPLEGSYKVVLPWKPNKPGDYEIFVEIVPQTDATMLEGTVNKTISVK